MSCDRTTAKAGVGTPRIEQLPPRELTEAERANLHEYRKNKGHFLDNHEQIVAEHPNCDLLIFDGGQVAAFDNLGDLFTFKEQLDKPTRQAAYLPHRWSGAVSSIIRVVR